MKRLLLLAITALLTFQASAQNNPKSVFISTGISGSIKNEDGSTSRSISINPSINYMINKQLAVGFFVNHNRTTIAADYLNVYTTHGYYTFSKENTTKVRNWSVGPQVRYYYPILRQLYFLVEAQGGVNLEIMKTDYTVTSTLAPGEEPNPFPAKPEFYFEDKEFRDNALFFQAKVTPGIVYFLHSEIALEFKVNIFDYAKVLDSYKAPFGKDEDENQNSGFKLNNASIGASFYFR